MNWAIIYLGRYLNALSISVLLNFFHPNGPASTRLAWHRGEIQKGETQVRIQPSLLLLYGLSLCPTIQPIFFFYDRTFPLMTHSFGKSN